jgi:hypothetical protein
VADFFIFMLSDGVAASAQADDNRQSMANRNVRRNVLDRMTPPDSKTMVPLVIGWNFL